MLKLHAYRLHVVGNVGSEGRKSQGNRIYALSGTRLHVFSRTGSRSKDSGNCLIRA